MTNSSNAVNHVVSPILGYLRGTAGLRGPHGERTVPVLPFVTISRQAGAGGTALARRLAEHLNGEAAGGERHWSVFDRELVDKVAADHHINQELVDMLERHNRTWVEEFFNGMTFEYTPSELRVFRSLVSSVRALAQAGLVILVGRGAYMITQNMPGGLHVRLVAPREHRIGTMMALRGQTQAQAADQIRWLDQEREAFLRKHWPDNPLAPERFTITFNTAALTEPQMVRCVVDLLETVSQPVTG